MGTTPEKVEPRERMGWLPFALTGAVTLAALAGLPYFGAVAMKTYEEFGGALPAPTQVSIRIVELVQGSLVPILFAALIVLVITSLIRREDVSEQSKAMMAGTYLIAAGATIGFLYIGLALPLIVE